MVKGQGHVESQKHCQRGSLHVVTVSASCFSLYTKLSRLSLCLYSGFWKNVWTDFHRTFHG